MKYPKLRWTIVILLIVAVLLGTWSAANSQSLRITGSIGSTLQGKIRPVGSMIISIEPRETVRYVNGENESSPGHMSLSAEMRSVVGKDQPTYFGGSIGFNIFLNQDRDVLIKPYFSYHYELQTMDDKSLNRGWAPSGGLSVIIKHLYFDAAYIRGYKVGIGITGLL